jgi:predicted ATP-binding protein involved in virulence
MEQAYNLILEELSLKNFRCFRDLNLSFEEQLTVIIAENGGGKTAILEAIAGSLKTYLAQLKVKGYKQTNILTKDVSIGATGDSYSFLTVDLEYATIEKNFDFSGKPTIDFKYEEEVVTLDYTYSFFEKIISKFKDEAIPLKDLDLENIPLPVLVYFGGESVKVEYNTKLTSSPDKLQLIYQNALEGNRFAFTHFYNWWKNNEDRMLRMKKESQGYEAITNQFKKIQTAVEYLMNDEDSKPTYKNLRINEDLKMGMDKFNYDKNGNLENNEGDFIEVSQFSAGEKSLFAYVADLGLRLLHANPSGKSAEEVGLHVFKGRGVALVDEIGLHLHPKWQQKVIGKLLEIFPEMQFVVTTHSPLVLSNVYSKHIRSIENGQVYGVSDTFGHADADDMLRLMGFQSKTREKIRTIHRLLHENKIQEAKDLRATIETEGTFAPLLEIDLFIRRKER